MKKLLATALVSAAVAIAARGQGTVNFVNYFTGTASDPRVYFSDGVTGVSGSQYRVMLFGGPTAGSMGSLVTTTFLGFGYFVGPSVAVPGVPGGVDGFFQVAAWDSTLNGTTTGATFAQAQAYSAAHGLPLWGISAVFENPTGDPTATPPGLPADLLNMPSFRLDAGFPEPSSTALGALAAAMWLGRARVRTRR